MKDQIYFPQGGMWLKGNLHCHSTVSDGCYTPEEIVRQYESHGYKFLSITDHNVFVPHDDLTDGNIILMTGVEHDIAYGPNKCTHLVGTGMAGRTETSYPCRRYTSGECTDQQLADKMIRDGQFVTLAHPVWSRMELPEITSLQGIQAIEVYNNGTEHLCHGGNAEVIWNQLLRSGRHILATASDDTHVPGDLFGGWIVVKAREHTKAAILDALWKGLFYASSGPEIYEYELRGGILHVACSDCREIHFVTYLPRGKSYFSDGKTPLREADFRLTGEETYCRCVCVDSEGHSAWTEPIYLNEEE